MLVPMVEWQFCAVPLLKDTTWRDLGVLVLDLLPDMGDVQLEVCQLLSLSGAMAASLPSILAWADMLKGVHMFGNMGVMTLALVENMSYFICKGGVRHYPFGKSQFLDNNAKVSLPSPSQFLPNPSHVFHLPITTTMNASTDSGLPLFCDQPDGAEDELTAFLELANVVAIDLMMIQHGLPPLLYMVTIAKKQKRKGYLKFSSRKPDNPSSSNKIKP